MKLFKIFTMLFALLILQISIAGGIKYNSSLHAAVQNRNVEKCNALLENGMNVNSQNYGGKTPLMQSIISNKECFYRILKDKNVNVNLADNAGWTALHHAADFGDGKMCDALLKQHANINAKNKNDETPLMKSISVNKKKSFHRILEGENINVNVADKNGSSALHLAVDIRHEDTGKNMCAALLKKFSNVNARNKNGETPLIAATRQSKIRIIEILLKNHADE